MMDVMFEIPSESKKEYKVTLELCKTTAGKSEYGKAANCLISNSKAIENDCFCFFLKILVVFCLVITKLFITLFGSLEGG